MIKELGAWIETKTALVVGTSLFLGYADQDASNLVSLQILIDNTGSLTFPELRDRFDWVITHIARHTEWDDAHDLAWAMMDVIHSRFNIDFPIVGGAPQLNAQAMWAASSPQHIGEDDKTRHIFSTDYLIKIKDKV